MELGDEHLPSKTWPACGHQYNPRGRVYRCPTCGLVAHRDVVGSVNILLRKVQGAVGVYPAAAPGCDDVSLPCLAGKAWPPGHGASGSGGPVPTRSRWAFAHAEGQIV